MVITTAVALVAAYPLSRFKIPGNSVPWTTLFLTATSLPFAVWIGTNFIDSVPIDLEEAASTEGAGIFQTLRYITLPLVTPGAVVIAFYTFIQAWSNFFVPFILLTTPKSPAGVTIYQYFGQYTTNYSGLAAFSLVFAAVPVIFYVVLSKRGGGASIFSGAVKADLRRPALAATAAVPSLGG
jgi:multiple sugar transport system permease protein